MSVARVCLDICIGPMCLYVCLRVMCVYKHDAGVMTTVRSGFSKSVFVLQVMFQHFYLYICLHHEYVLLCLQHARFSITSHIN